MTKPRFNGTSDLYSNDDWVPRVRAALTDVDGALNRLLASARNAAELWFVRRGVGPALADELAQEVILRLSRSYQRIDLAHAGGYLLVVTLNVWRTARARRRIAAHRTTSLSVIHEVPDQGLLPDDEVVQRDLLLRLERACDSLPSPKVRDVMRCALRGDTNAEIAVTLGLSHDVVKERKARGRRQLRKAMDYTV